MSELETRVEDVSIETDLTELIMSCPELPQLEAQLSQFNIFRVLRADRNELRHSNMLAWLFTPDESHGFDDLFLRRWLMIVLQRAGSMTRPSGWISPIAVDVLDIERIDVHREFENIDLLFAIHRKQETPWIICVENKVDSSQSRGQLKRYYDIVERRFSDAERRIYVFLTRSHEAPAHPAYIESSYEDVLQVLDQCIAERANTIGPEPLLLMQHYRQLLEDDFMEESEASRLARQIYLRHRRALDYIFENKADPVFEATTALETILTKEQERLGILMGRSQKGYVRFVPKAWDLPQNIGGTAWGPESRYLVCEVYLWSKKAELHMVVGKAPEDWADLVWARAVTAPFKQEWKSRPKQFIKPFKAKSDIAIESLLELDDEETGSRLLAWLEEEFAKVKFGQAVEVFVELLKELKSENA